MRPQQRAAAESPCDAADGLRDGASMRPQQRAAAESPCDAADGLRDGASMRPQQRAAAECRGVRVAKAIDCGCFNEAAAESCCGMLAIRPSPATANQMLQ